jgi:hypothetical protein
MGDELGVDEAGQLVRRLCLAEDCRPLQFALEQGLVAEVYAALETLEFHRFLAEELPRKCPSVRVIR